MLMLMFRETRKLMLWYVAQQENLNYSIESSKYTHAKSIKSYKRTHVLVYTAINMGILWIVNILHNKLLQPHSLYE